MAYNVTKPCLVEIQIVGSIDGQKTRTVFHYLVSGTGSITDGEGKMLDLLSTFETNVYEPYRACCSEDWHAEAITGQFIQGTRWRMVPKIPVELSGNMTAPTCPSTTAGVVSLTADLAGHAYQGRRYIPAVSTASNNHSLASDDYFANLTTLGTAIAEELEDSDHNVYKPTLATGKVWPLVTDQLITDSEPRRPLRVQRRREVGVGE